MRAPVLPPSPRKLSASYAEARGDDVRTGLVKQPVRLRLALRERPWRIEAIKHPLAVEEQQPIHRATTTGEEQQRELARCEDPVLIERQRDFPITVGQMVRQLRQPIGCDAALPRRRS